LPSTNATVAREAVNAGGGSGTAPPLFPADVSVRVADATFALGTLDMVKRTSARALPPAPVPATTPAQITGDSPELLSPRVDTTVVSASNAAVAAWDISLTGSSGSDADEHPTIGTSTHNTARKRFIAPPTPRLRLLPRLAPNRSPGGPAPGHSRPNSA